METAGLIAILLFGLLNTLVLWAFKKPLLAQGGALVLSLILYSLSPVWGLSAFLFLEGWILLQAYQR
ncbi:MAG: hypothetical protein ACUVUP_00455 [Thermaceae bacterium]